jgi:hypothetical protein
MSWLFYYIVFSFVLKQKKQKFKAPNEQNKQLFLIALMAVASFFVLEKTL